MSININTTTQQYTNFVDGLDTLDTQIMARAPLFNKLSSANKILWLQRDPLLKKTLRFVLKYAAAAERIQEELNND